MKHKLIRNVLEIEVTKTCIKTDLYSSVKFDFRKTVLNTYD